MQLRSRHCLAVLGLLVSAACADFPTAPTPSAGDARQREHVTTYPGTRECDPWMNLDWCEGGGVCMTSATPYGQPEEYMGVQGCPPGGGPPRGGGGGTPTEPPPPADTCQTGEPKFDSPAVEQGLKDLWTRSNPTATQAQRLEQAAWIIQDSNGSYRMAPFATTGQGPCNINGNLNPPPGAVAWVHTHPFTRGEIQTICGAMKQPDPSAPGGFRDVIGPNGQPVYPEYRNNPSVPDRELLHDLNSTMVMLGRPKLDGVIVDANRTTVYSANAGKATTTYPRCVY